MSQTKFFTNQDGNSLLKKFEGVFEHMTSIRQFDALVGYFRTSGYFKVRQFLDNIPQIRILVGINVDQLIKKHHDKGQQYLKDAGKTKEDFMKDIIENIQEADYDEVTEKGIIQFMDDLINEKIELRAHPEKKIHAKVYIFRPVPFNEYAACEVITGSSNLTDAGLGANPESNYEFNVSLRDYSDVQFATDEFEKLWNESVPILHAEIAEIKKATYLKDDFSPFELYIKMLIEYFGKRVEYDPYNIDLLLPDKYMRLKYQSDAANQGYAIMMKHNGFILADVVGLGKTIVACMVVKKFIYENGTHTRILVVVPPALESAWRRTTEDFQIKIHFEFITLGSLNRILNEENYSHSNADKFDLVIVDESHKFRNDYTEMYIQLEAICKRPRARASEEGDTRKKVILISATPLNNRPEDIENQLYLFQDRRYGTIENVRNLQEYFKPINKNYKELSAELRQITIPAERRRIVQKIRQLFMRLRDDVIEPLVIRRTRTDILKNDDYIEDLNKQGIKFPDLKDPESLHYELEGSLATLFSETVSQITGLDENGNEIDGLGYFRYRAIEFLISKEDKDLYGNVESISNRLAAIMRTLLVKRLESSFFAFCMSLDRLQKAIDNMLDMFSKDRVFVAPDLDINKLLEDGFTYEQIEKKLFEKGGNNREFKSASFDQKFIDHLKSDKKKIDNLASRWKKVKRDPKIEEFANQVEKVFFNPKINQSGKLVIFTESTETAEKISGHIAELTGKKLLTVSSDNRKHLETLIRANFDANLEEENWSYEYDIIITTEVLAEGINLHRSNVIINYDVPWNATRLMQRIGRVNRIGTRADRIFVYNFYPSSHGDEQISLVNNALRKLQAFHSAFGEDTRIFSLLEEKEEGGLFGTKIQTEESEILRYLNELRDFRKKNKKRFAEIEKIPNKARCGREVESSAEVLLSDGSGNEIKYPIQRTTLSYYKSENHPGIFCLVTPDLIPLELNFLQAARLFKAQDGEQPIKIHDLHFDQAKAGFNFFTGEKNQQTVRPLNKRNLSPAENKANSTLNALLKHAPTEQKRGVMQRAIEVIKKGSFGSLGFPKEINDFFTKNSGLLANERDSFFDEFFIQVLDKYDLSPRPDEKTDEHTGVIVKPQIVLSQSFYSPNIPQNSDHLTSV
jgi:superfamily II DNA or RNA helicase